MTGLAWQTARARATGLAGSFIALALGVALLAAMALTLAALALRRRPAELAGVPE